MKFLLNKYFVELHVVFPFSTEKRSVSAHAVTKLLLFTIVIPVFTFAKNCVGQTLRSCTEGCETLIMSGCGQGVGRLQVVCIQQNMVLHTVHELYLFVL